MRLNLRIINVPLLLFLASGNIFPADLTEVFAARTFRSKKYSSLPYRLLIPKQYLKTRAYPLVLFLHGSDERGTDNMKQLYVGLNIFADEKMMRRYPCFIAAPQCPTGMKWVDVNWKEKRHTMHENPTPSLAMAVELVEELQNEFSIDNKRIYITGYSMGGFGAWEAIERRPDLFAAAVPVCGGGDETKAFHAARMPIWAFHGALDQIVKVSRSRNMIDAIVMAGGMPRYTEYPEINHFSWGLAYSDPQVLEWLFKQKK
jgi:predicted peptidase